ncbi:MAG: PAS domain S-box protein [Rhodocyclaceae bacterium]|nr:PAS domain S-box protein [Rhodocyclaceae bacterium]
MSVPKLKDPSLNLLLVDGGAEGPALVVERFREAGYKPTWRQVGDAAALREALATQTWDAVLCAHGIPGLTALAALRLMRDLKLDLPFLVISPTGEEKAAIRAMKSGAHDCLARDHLERLVPAVEREVREARHRADLRAALAMLHDSESHFRTLASNLPGMVFQLVRHSNGEMRFMYVSEGCQKLFGWKQHDLMESSERFFCAVDQEDSPRLKKALAESARAHAPLNWEGRIRSRNQTRWINIHSLPHATPEGELHWHGIVTDITRSKDIEGELRRSREQLSELSSYLEGAKEEERERIARDIHDELGSLLVAIKIETALLASKLPAAPAGLKQKAAAIESLLDQAMGTASRVARELRPGILKEFGLPEAIKCQVEDFAQRTGIACRAQTDDGLDGVELEERTSLALFRIVQEALTNIAKHAHASLVAVRLTRETGNIVLEIRDNGRGILDSDMAKPKSFGLRGIRERIHSLGGEFSVAAGEHGGTHLALRIPEQPGIDAAPAEEEPQQRLF